MFLCLFSIGCGSTVDTGGDESAETYPGCFANVSVLVYNGRDTNVITDALAAKASPCADYFITLPPYVSDKTMPRADGEPAHVRKQGKHFHALAQFQWSAWMAWVAADSSRTWEAAGRLFRQRMDDAGYDVASGDTWAINEYPSTLFTDEGTRVHAENLVKGLHEGGKQPTKGAIYIAGRGPEVKPTLENLLVDAPFWNAMEAHTRWWADEVYPIPKQVCVPGTTVAERSSHINELIEHTPRLASVGPSSAGVARSYLNHAYVPLLNAAWKADPVYGTTDVTLAQMENHVSTQIYAARAWSMSHAYPGGRVGISWTWIQPEVSLADEQTLAARTAESIAGAYGPGGEAQHACAPSGAYTWCQCSIAGSSFDLRWQAFSSW